MKRSVKIVIGVFALVLVVSAVLTSVYIFYIKSLNAVIPKGFTVTAHTGCEGTEDNSIDAIIKGASVGANIVEFDLSFNDEGEAFLAHNEIGDGCVSLKEAFETVAKYDNLQVNVDCKGTQNLKAVSETAKEFGILDRIFYTGLKADDVKIAKEVTPEIPYYLNKDIDKDKKNDEEYIKSLIHEVKDLGAVGININYGGASKKMAELFHKEGLLISVWTVNKTLDMHKVLTYGCDNITTRQPKKLVEIIKEKEA